MKWDEAINKIQSSPETFENSKRLETEISLNNEAADMKMTAEEIVKKTNALADMGNAAEIASALMDSDYLSIATPENIATLIRSYDLAEPNIKTKMENIKSSLRFTDKHEILYAYMEFLLNTELAEKNESKMDNNSQQIEIRDENNEQISADRITRLSFLEILDAVELAFANNDYKLIQEVISNLEKQQIQMLEKRDEEGYGLLVNLLEQINEIVDNKMNDDYIKSF